MLIYFLRGRLPWQGLVSKSPEQREELILEKKKTTSIKDLCDGLPDPFAIYLNHVKSLDPETKPPYSYLRKSFRNLFVKMRFEYDNVYDWTVLLYQISLDQAKPTT